MFFPNRRYDSRATCTALPHVRRLSLELGIISFWLGFGLCLEILFAPCGCRRVYCGPHCGRESARVLASLFGSFPSGVGHLSRVCSSVLRPLRSRSPIPSLAPSWWSLCLLMRWAVLTLSGCVLSVPSAFSLRRSRLSIPFAMPPLSRSVFAGGIRLLRAVALAEGRLPMRWVLSEPLGLAVAPPISPYTGPRQSLQFYRTPFGAQVGVSCFSCAAFRRYSWRSFCQFHWLIRVPA